MSSWQKYPFRKFNQIPNKPGVYVICIDGLPVYVGQSFDVRSWLYAHNIRYGYARNILLPWGSIPDNQLVSVKVGFSKKYGDWTMRELRLIRRLQPKYNYQCKRNILKLASNG